MRRLLSTSLLVTALAASALAADAAGDTPKPKPYVLDTCIVSGDKLGGMGDPVVVVRDGREIKFCCKGCIKDFDKDPAAFVKKIEAAEQAKADAKAGAKTDAMPGMDHGAHQH